uniref:Uncharacterized protein n=1 Tax=Heterorhabditis bacteriophora TaxID=37862 RepID=A0A1I7W6P2_HETBA
MFFSIFLNYIYSQNWSNFFAIWYNNRKFDADSKSMPHFFQKILKRLQLICKYF